MSDTNTFNRGQLWRLCKAGRLVMVGAYTFDDQYGESRAREELPVLPHPGSVHDMRSSVCYLRHDEFRSGSGAAWVNPDGTVTLHVHSNSSYTFRIVPELE